ncbi:MAG: Eco57I restriction-modification methylase domain-containing protein [Bacteroidota bacterium]
MGAKEFRRNKINGVFYTPFDLAQYLAKDLVRISDIKVFDPSCGEVALLLAAKHTFVELLGGNDKIQLYGCDRVIPKNKVALSQIKFIKSDFLKLESQELFDVIVTNPPFVRYHRISKTKRIEYHNWSKSVIKTLRPADLWVHFLIKSIFHLQKGGSLGAILPWSFLQADYAIDVRNWLAERFEKIRVQILGKKFFDSAQERVILLWLHNYGSQKSKIEIAFTREIESEPIFQNISIERWSAKKVLSSSNKSTDIEAIINKYIDNHGFRRFKEFGSVSIGVVTGANSFFVLDMSSMDRLGIERSDSIPILTKKSDLRTLSLNGEMLGNRLVQFSRENEQKYSDYLKFGENKGYHLRAHSQNRSPWYRVKIGKIPDAFICYRTSDIPFVMINNGEYQCTNSIHRINFKNLNEDEVKWIQVSLLSIQGQLSLEAYSKIYGSGVLKIEPSSLMNSIVRNINKHFPESKYKMLSDLLSRNKNLMAVELATEIVNNELGVSDHLYSETKLAFEELRDRRKWHASKNS